MGVLRLSINVVLQYAYSRQDAVTRCGEATLEAHNHRRAHLKKYE